MVVEVVAPSSRGQQLLLDSPHSPSEIATLADCTRQQVSEYRSGRAKPSAPVAARLEAAGIVPAAAWGLPPVQVASAPQRPAPADVATLDDAALDGFGLSGIEKTIVEFRRARPDLPPREQVVALQALGRLHERWEVLTQKRADARQDYLESSAFAEDCRLIAAAVPSSTELHAALARFGVHLPSTATATTSTPPPTTRADVGTIVRKLEEARELEGHGERDLAVGRRLALDLGAHADALAQILAPDADLSAKLLGLLDATDETIVRRALERRIAVDAAKGMPSEGRRTVGHLLAAIGHEDIAVEIGGPDVVR